jgi:hypothetical protein
VSESLARPAPGPRTRLCSPVSGRSVGSTRRRIVPDLEIACGERSCRNNLLNLFCSWRYRAGIHLLCFLCFQSRNIRNKSSVPIPSCYSCYGLLLLRWSSESKLNPSSWHLSRGCFLLLGGRAVGVRMSTSPIGSISSGETVGHESRNHPFFCSLGLLRCLAALLCASRFVRSDFKGLFLLLVPSGPSHPFLIASQFQYFLMLHMARDCGSSGTVSFPR